MWMFSLVGKLIVSVLFPKRCIVCKKSGESFCRACLVKIPRAVDSPSTFIVSIFSFKDEYIRKSIHAIKYFHRKDLILPLVQEMVRELQRSPSFLEKRNNRIPFVIIPIPMSRTRKYLRGYNQTEAIAQTLAQELSLPYDGEILMRTTSPKRQVLTRTKRERLYSQRGTFSLQKDVSQTTILLVDDVTTTGATLTEARRTLLQAGVKHVLAVTIAH